MVDLLVIDFETFYDRDFSLSKLTTEEYIRDDLFEVIGVAVKRNDEPAVWFSGPKRETKKWLEQWDWDSGITVAHNAMFDMAILNWHFDVRPKRIADTLSMSRAKFGPDAGHSLAKLAERLGIGVKGNEVVNALGKGRLDFTPEELARYGDYCINDVELTYEAFLELAQGFPPVEFRLIDLTMRMFTEPVLTLDKEVLRCHLAEVKEKKDKLLSKALVDKSELMSNPKLADLLRRCGVEPPMKISLTTGKGTYAFGKNDEAFKALLDHESFNVQAIVAARMGVKSTLEETRTERFLGIAERGTLPVPLRYYAAHTGRFGGDDKVNLQNIPRKSALKRAIKAPDGHVLIDCDSSQIEARTLAWLAGQDDLVEAFDKGEDVYKIMAAKIYKDKSVEEIDDAERFVGKTTILGCLAEGTLVLTDRGWVAIEDVTLDDRLWDGEEWVCHQGLVKKGTKETLSVSGLWLTPDHKILCGTQWLEAQLVASDGATLSRALATGAVNWLSLDTSRVSEVGFAPSSFDAIAEAQNTQLTATTSKTSGAPGALNAGGEKGIVNGIGSTSPYSPRRGIVHDYSTDSPLPSVAATYLPTECTQTMGGGVYAYASSGVMTGQRSYGTPKPYRGGITPNSIWTELTTAGGMNPETFGLSRGQIITLIEGRSVSSRRSLMTYDIAYAGPRNRYTVATTAGPIIVHNCGYGMGGKRFQAQLKGFGVDMAQQQCNNIISIYRETYPQIPGLWEDGGKVLDALHQNVKKADTDVGKTQTMGRDGVLLVDETGIQLPNGLYLRYPGLELDKGEYSYATKRGGKVRIYGGKVVENVCQALARIIIVEQMLMISRRYKVAMTVHDSVVAIAPQDEAEEAQAFVEACMRTRPKWAAGLPLNCESKVGASYGG